MKHALKNALQKIEEQKITPEPRWKFLAKKGIPWFVFGGVALLGAISLSIAYDAISQLDWDVYRFVRTSSVTYTLSLLPYFWIFSIGVLLCIALWDLRKTENGYRYGPGKLALAGVGGVFLLGFLFVWFGWGRQGNIWLMQEMPYYQKHIMMTKEAQWMQPEKGLLSGTIRRVSDDGISLTDLSGVFWEVETKEETIVRPSVSLRIGEKIKILGEKKSDNIFNAREIRPWTGRGMMNENGKTNGGRRMHGE